MRLRRAAPDDARALARVHVRSWRAAYRGLLPDAFLDGLDEEDHALRWRLWLEEGRSRTWLAEAEGGAAGFCTLRPPDPLVETPAEIPLCYVDPDHWRQGVGRAMIERVLREARAAGWGEVVLWVLEANAPARRFYEAVGFTDDGGRKADASLTGETLREARYRIAP